MTPPRPFFQSMNDILPEDQEVVTVSPEEPVTEAVSVMRRYRFSQLPVEKSGRVVGMFSYRSFTYRLLEIIQGSTTFQQEDLVVEEFMERPPFRSVDESPEDLLDDLDHEPALLIGSKTDLAGIVTVIDVLRHLYLIARPFVLVSQLERMIRQLISACVTGDALMTAARRAMAGKKYEDRDDVPTRLTEMTMDDYVWLVRYSKNWTDHFAQAFSASGSTFQRARVEEHLKEIRDLRNQIVHLRSSPTEEDLRVLKRHGRWLRTRIDMFIHSDDS